ncbi:hypothetical protein [Coleofasciculus sp. H7-2]
MVSRKITRTDQQQIRAGLLQDSLKEAEHILIDRVLYGIRHGLLRLKD